MKRLFTLIATAIMTVSTISAQTSVSSGSPDMTVAVKRCIAQGDNVFIDLVVTCSARWNKIGLSRCKMFDDEGNDLI